MTKQVITKVPVTCFVYRHQTEWMNKPSYLALGWKAKNDNSYVFLEERTFEIEVSDPDMIADRVAGLRAEMTRVSLEAEEKLTVLCDHESKLLCLINEVLEN